MRYIVAIDGTSGSGKGTITQKLAKEINFLNLDTGALYRCVTLQVIRQKVDLTDTKKIVEIAENMEVKFEKKLETDEEIVLLNGEDVTKEIRSTEVTTLVMDISQIKEVREKMVDIQRNFAKDVDIIMEGRDIGTCVFPNADVKIYLDADINERAKRRYKENTEKGIITTYEEVLELLKYRDKIDKEREISPLIKAPDAVIVDSTNMTICEATSKIKDIITKKIKLKTNK